MTNTISHGEKPLPGGLGQAALHKTDTRLYPRRAARLWSPHPVTCCSLAELHPLRLSFGGKMDYPKRKHPRLKEYDYSQNGAYYITICVKGHQCLLGSIENRIMRRSHYGEIAEKLLCGIEGHYDYVHVVNHIVMPNHVHILLQKDMPPQILLAAESSIKTASIDTIVHAFKRLVTKEIGHSIWQSSFYEHVIRNSEDILRVSDYIDANPRRWRTDKT
ncbi:MAG: transposase [Oscillospiraceae bacterium]|nr:transposase [Oscillospiraceae bacterium]